MRVLLLNSSPHGNASHGYRLAKEMFAALQQTSESNMQDLKLIERDLVAEPLPIIDQKYAAAITSKTPIADAFDWSERLICEIEQTDMLMIATPMHNFTVPASLKLWIDHVLRIHRTFTPTPAGKIGLMQDRPTFVIVGSGGFHAGERARQPDFLTPYVRYALGSIGIKNVKFILLEGLVFGDAAVEEAVAAARREMMVEIPFNAVQVVA